MKCENTDGGYVCGCIRGYTLNRDNSTCRDINECALGTHVCQQKCVNTNGSYECHCNHGYQRVKDRCLGNLSFFILYLRKIFARSKTNFETQLHSAWKCSGSSVIKYGRIPSEWIYYTDILEIVNRWKGLLKHVWIRLYTNFLLKCLSFLGQCSSVLFFYIVVSKI